jgi:hypothetical protein
MLHFASGLPGPAFFAISRQNNGGTEVSEIRMTVEARTDYEAEATGLPAERWAEAVFQVGETEIVFEVSVEDDIIVSIIPGDETAGWKGTLKGLTGVLKGEIPGR